MTVSRRAWLKGVAAAGLATAVPRLFAWSAGEKHAGGRRAALLAYLARQARPDGGFAFGDQQRSHLSATHAVIGSYRLLGETAPGREALIAFIRSHHPSALKKLNQPHRVFDLEQIEALQWLGDDAADLAPAIQAITAPWAYDKYFERDGNPVLHSESAVVQCHALLGLPPDRLKPAYPEYFAARRRANGSFNTTPAEDGSDGHVMNTLWSLQALRCLGEAENRVTGTVAWLQSCQREDGAFSYQPNAPFADVDDIGYTRAALRALRLLGATARNREACRRWILSLVQPDGGFSDRPGWLSNPVATFVALDALDALGSADVLAEVATPAVRPRRILAPDLKIYTAQIEAHGAGSPVEAVAVAAAARIDLWGAKNASAAWLERARRAAADTRTPVRFFTSREEQGTWVRMPGVGTYSHTSDLIAPDGADIGASIASDRSWTWPEYRARRLGPLERAGGCLIWQFGENEEITRLFLDDSLARGGYAAISTFHFYNPDFVNSEPFLERWRGQLPFVALQDAHGYEAWWASELLTGSRTLFLAKEPTWEGWREALRMNRVLAMRHDRISRGETWMHYGSEEVRDFVLAREAEWRWWDNPRRPRPLASLVVVRPEDEFEAGRPERGVALRVRCAWACTIQNTPETPIAELVILTLDGRALETEKVERARPKNPALGDVYQLAKLPGIAAGAHAAVAVAREIATGREERITVEFSI